MGKAKAKSKKAAKLVYFFSAQKSEGDRTMKNLLGGKGSNLADMCKIGLPVPPGFTITTEVCDLYYKNGKKHTKELLKQVEDNIASLEKTTGKKFGDKKNPLLVSVRSGAAVSMPGMMDTVLNLGINDAVVEVLAKKSGNARFAWDAYRRFLQMFGDVAMGVPHHAFEHELEAVKIKFAKAKKIKNAATLKQEALNQAVPDTALTTDDFERCCRAL